MPLLKEASAPATVAVPNASSESVTQGVDSASTKTLKKERQIGSVNLSLEILPMNHNPVKQGHWKINFKLPLPLAYTLPSGEMTCLLLR